MAQKSLTKKLQQPIHPGLAVFVAIVGVIVIGALFTLAFQHKSAVMPAPQQYQSQFTPSSIPTPTINTVEWKTYTDWKYGYSVKLPPEFASVIPDKGYTGDTIDPQGNGFVQFKDTTLSGDYPNRISKYGFDVRIEPGTPGGSNCTTDQECLNLIKKNVGLATVMPLQARILNRTIQGLSMQPATTPGDNDIVIDYFYPFTNNGKVFTASVNFYYPKSFQETQTKAPFINAILSTISFNQ